LYYTRNPPSTTTNKSTSQSPSTTNNNNYASTTDLGDGWYEISKITNRRMISGKRHFFVHWKQGDRSYEPEENISDYAKAQYYAQCQASPSAVSHKP